MDGIFSEEGLKIYYQKFGIDKTFLVFSEKQNPSKCSCGHLECSLHNAAGKRSSKLWKKWITIPKFWNIFNIFEVDHPKKISHHKKCSFNKPAVRVPPKVKKNITQESKIDKTKVGAKSENVYVETPIAV